MDRQKVRRELVLGHREVDAVGPAAVAEARGPSVRAVHRRRDGPIGGYRGRRHRRAKVDEGTGLVERSVPTPGETCAFRVAAGQSRRIRSVFLRLRSFPRAGGSRRAPGRGRADPAHAPSASPRADGLQHAATAVSRLAGRLGPRAPRRPSPTTRQEGGRRKKKTNQPVRSAESV